MKFPSLLVAAMLLGVRGASLGRGVECTSAPAGPRVIDAKRNITYAGLGRNGIEVFLGIPFGQDTGGANRFRPPRPHTPARGSVVDATAYGPACPQSIGAASPPYTFTDVSEISEDCLNLVIGRPRGTTGRSRLPVMVWIHGGFFWSGQNRESTTAPDGLVRGSVANGLPVIVVAVNYRLGVFGFARSDALGAEGSTNAGLRDQRLALEWVRDHIGQFGGDPDRVTISGQSSGGLAVGMQIMAYGGAKPVPFRQGICQSQANEPGITANFTIDAMQLVVDAAGCGAGGLHSAATVECLRGLDMETVLNASIATYIGDIAHNIGDIWLPAVDGDFLPAAPSRLIREGRFANVTAMIGWCQDDLTFFTDTGITTDAQAHAFIQSYIPTMTPANVAALLALYPVTDFAADEEAGLSAQFYRAARVFRDILMVCQPLSYASALAARNGGGTVYLYDWNQTVSDQVIEGLTGETGYGVIHGSDIAYVFGHLAVYGSGDYPFRPAPADYALAARAPRSWSTFASTGRPGRPGHDTFAGFAPAFPAHGGGADGRVGVFVAGGPHEGFSPIDGPGALPEVEAQKLRERCAFLNSDEIIEQLRY